MIRVSINEKNCLACGSCLSADHIIRERSDGKAETISGISIASADLPNLKKLVSTCPVDAISYTVVTEETLTEKKAKKLVDTFQKRLRAIVLPKPKYCDLVYVKEDYHIERPSLPLEIRPYSSYSKAENAVLDHFKRNLYKNHRAFFMDLATQYKVAKAHEYETYGPTSYYGRWNERIGRELTCFYEELMLATNGHLPLPPSFMEFRPFVDLSPNHVEKRWISRAVEDMASKAWSAMEDNYYYSLDFYKQYIDVYDYDLVDEGILWDSTKTEYVVLGCEELVEEFIGDLEQVMSMLSPQDYMESAIQYTLNGYCSEVNKCLCDKLSLVEQAFTYYGIGPVFDDLDSFRLYSRTQKLVTVEE